MSITSMCSRDTVTVKNQTNTKTAGGAAAKVWTTGTRTVSCRIQSLSAEEIVAFGVRAGVRAWKLYSATNPTITETTHVFFTDGSESIEAAVIRPSRQYDNQDRLWITVVEYFGPYQAS